MDIKQVLYDNLLSQLSILKKEYNDYNESISIPAQQKLEDEINSWFKINFIYPFSELKFAKDLITLSFSDPNDKLDNKWKYKLEIQLKRDFSKKEYIGIQWENTYGARLDDDVTGVYLKFLGELTTRSNSVTNKFINEWAPSYREIIKDKEGIYTKYTSLETSLNKLKNEIKEDELKSMKEIGFELESFKPEYKFNYYGEDKNKITTVDKLIPFQYGRASHQYVYVNGFKVIGKEGNKYQVEVKERSYCKNEELYKKSTLSITELKFNYFINNVNKWENKTSIEYKQEAEKLFNKYKEQTDLN